MLSVLRRRRRSRRWRKMKGLLFFPVLAVLIAAAAASGDAGSAPSSLPESPSPVDAPGPQNTSVPAPASTPEAPAEGPVSEQPDAPVPPEAPSAEAAIPPSSSGPQTSQAPAAVLGAPPPTADVPSTDAAALSPPPSPAESVPTSPPAAAPPPLVEQHKPPYSDVPPSASPPHSSDTMPKIAVSPSSNVGNNAGSSAPTAGNTPQLQAPPPNAGFPATPSASRRDHGQGRTRIPELAPPPVESISGGSPPPPSKQSPDPPAAHHAVNPSPPPPLFVRAPDASPAPRGTGKQAPNAPPAYRHAHPESPPAPPPPPALSSASSPPPPATREGIPTIPSSPYSSKEPDAPLPQPALTLPPPPPNNDCNALSCAEPLTDPPIGSPCACVLPMKVGLRLRIALYAFFPLVSEFAQEVASGVQMELNQVRVMGANVANEQPEKTVVIIHLVPRQERFDNSSALSVYDTLWGKKVALKEDTFGGDYEVLYVLYPGLPPPPPSAPADLDAGAGVLGDTASGNSRTMKPLGVDVGMPQRRANGGAIAVAVLSALIVLILCAVVGGLLLARRRANAAGDDAPQSFLLPQYRKTSSGTGSFSSSMATFTGQARTFRLAEIASATDGFDEAKVLGEGGFGCVYQGTLEDGTRVAVKVLRRDDHQGEREFMAEVEMLGRLHHRNLVKLIGICVEDDARCLVYELIPNGSVESHLHGADMVTAPLDWSARMKIALGAARGLAYLHEDSSPCVIHRDFKSSNILLEYDFTPKVSDFGLAKVAGGDGDAGRHISTRVMGTFGYVAPEYAMTGHLLVKSDVYSYGVVLLELLTGRKPVDMSRPAGEENLVSWARPLLTNVSTLRDTVDPVLGGEVSFDGVAKVAAIAAMCVQPEAAHRPSMGEVVQALRLVCGECGDDGVGWRTLTLSQEMSAQAAAVYIDQIGIEAERVLLSDIFGSSPLFAGNASSAPLQRHSSSGPLTASRSSKKFWHRVRSLPRGSMSDCAGAAAAAAAASAYVGFETRSEGREP